MDCFLEVEVIQYVFGTTYCKGMQVITEFSFLIINITKNKPLHCKHRPTLGHDSVKNDLYPEIGGG